MDHLGGIITVIELAAIVPTLLTLAALGVAFYIRRLREL